MYAVDPNPGEHSLPTLKRWLAARLGTPGVANPNPGEGRLATLKRILDSQMIALTPAQALVADLLGYSPALLLLGDLGTLQGDGSPCVAGDPLTAACATWQDQSGNGNHATQATVMSRPLYVPAAIGGRAALRSDGMDDYLRGLLAASVSALTIYTVVYRYSPRSGFAGIFSLGPVGGDDYQGAGGVNANEVSSTQLHLEHAGASQTLTPDYSAPFLVRADYDGSGWQFALNGTPSDVRSPDFGPPILGRYDLFAREVPALGYYTAYYMGAMVIYPSAHASHSALESRLAAYYGIVLSA